MSILTYFDKVRVLIFAHQNRVRSMFLEFLYIVGGGGRPINVFLRLCFDVLRQSSRFHFADQNTLRSMFWSFVDNRRGGGGNRL